MILIITVAAYEDTDILVTYSHDIAEVASGAIQSTSLSAQEKASFLKNKKKFVPGKDYIFCTQILPKEGGKKQMLTFQNSWLVQHKWLVYSHRNKEGFASIVCCFLQQLSNQNRCFGITPRI